LLDIVGLVDVQLQVELPDMEILQR
jgi:hypothetical protein